MTVSRDPCIFSFRCVISTSVMLLWWNVYDIINDTKTWHYQKTKRRRYWNLACTESRLYGNSANFMEIEDTFCGQTDLRTGGRTFETHFIRSTRRSRLNKNWICVESYKTADRLSKKLYEQSTVVNYRRPSVSLAHISRMHSISIVSGDHIYTQQVR